MNPFEYVNAINNTKKDIMTDDIAERGYNSYIDNRLQFDFLINMVRKRKRFSKWEKVASESDVEVVKEYYGYNNEKARSALSLLTREQINELNKKVYKGGRK